MLFLSVRGFLDYAGPTVHSRLAWLPCCLPPTRNEVGILIYGLFAAQSPRPPMPLVYASGNTSRCPLQDSRSGWIRYFLSCRALASPTTCRFIPALSGFPVTREQAGSLNAGTCIAILPEVPHLEQQAIPHAAIPDSTNHFSLVNTLGESELDSACSIEGLQLFGGEFQIQTGEIVLELRYLPRPPDRG